MVGAFGTLSRTAKRFAFFSLFGVFVGLCCVAVGAVPGGQAVVAVAGAGRGGDGGFVGSAGGVPLLGGFVQLAEDEVGADVIGVDLDRAAEPFGGGFRI